MKLWKPVLVVGVMCGVAYSALPSPLCVNGHPNHRSSHVTYGGLPSRYGYQRDHIVPLGLGGNDTAGNIQYQSWSESARKDEIEHDAIRSYCAGRITLSQALETVRNWRNE